MTETLAHGYSSESTQQNISNEYQHDRVEGFQKSLGPCALDESGLSIGRVNMLEHGLTLRKIFISPAGLVTVNFTSPEIFLLALILMILFSNNDLC